MFSHKEERNALKSLREGAPASEKGFNGCVHEHVHTCSATSTSAVNFALAVCSLATPGGIWIKLQ